MVRRGVLFGGDAACQMEDVQFSGWRLPGRLKPEGVVSSFFRGGDLHHIDPHVRSLWRFRDLHDFIARLSENRSSDSANQASPGGVVASPRWGMKASA